MHPIRLSKIYATPDYPPEGAQPEMTGLETLRFNPPQNFGAGDFYIRLFRLKFRSNERTFRKVVTTADQSQETRSLQLSDLNLAYYLVQTTESSIILTTLCHQTATCLPDTAKSVSDSLLCLSQSSTPALVLQESVGFCR